MLRSRLIVLSGDAGAGKDSVVKVLINRGWTSYSLAGPLKRFVADMFGFTEEQLYGPSHARNEHNPVWDLKCLKCNGTGIIRIEYPPPVAPDYSNGPCPKCRGTGKTEISVRSTAQPLGTEYLRDLIHPDALTFRASWDLKELLHAGSSVVVNDARYDNDRNNLHSWLGGVRIDVRSERTEEKRGEGWRAHKSENDRATDDQLEYIIRNDEEWPFPSLHSKVEAMLRELYHDESNVR